MQNIYCQYCKYNTFNAYPMFITRYSNRQAHIVVTCKTCAIGKSYHLTKIMLTAGQKTLYISERTFEIPEKWVFINNVGNVPIDKLIDPNWSPTNLTSEQLCQ